MKVQEIKVDDRQKTALLERKKRRRKKRLRRLRNFILFILFSTTVVLLALSPLFNITQIEVKGSTRYGKQDLINASGLNKGVNAFKSMRGNISEILTLRYGGAEAAILKGRSFIKEASVRFIPPGSIRINIIERKPAALVPYMGTSLVVDDNAYVLDTDNGNGEDESLIIVKGIEVKSWSKGQALKMSNHERFEDFNAIISAVSKSDKSDKIKLYGHIDSIDVSDINNYMLVLDDRIKVNLGGMDDMDYKLQQLKQIAFNGGIGENEKGYLNFASGQYPVFSRE